MEIAVLITAVVYLLIAGIVVWAVQAIAASFPLPRPITIVVQAVIGIICLLLILRLFGLADV